VRQHDYDSHRGADALEVLRLFANPRARVERREEEVAKSLFLGNLPPDATEAEVKELFAPWGPVGEVRLIPGKGFGFVDVPDDKAAEAIAGTNGKQLKGSSLRVDEARPRRERTSHPGYGRGGGFGGGRGSRGGGGGRRRGRY